MNTINGVPPDDVGQVVQDFVDNGAEHVLVQRDADGTYSISAR